MIARLTVAMLCCGTAMAGFSPVLDRIEPRGGQRGTEMVMHFHGERLDGLQELLAYQPGIEVRALTAENDKHATANLFIRPDAPLGEHQFRIRCNGGITYQRSFFVGQFPTVNEVDPNDTPAQAQRVEPNTTVQGVAKVEDVDYYVCRLKKGQRFSAEVEAMRLGRTMFDSHVAIFDSKGFGIAACDDAPLLRTDSFVSVLIPADGDYHVVVREAAYEGSDVCQYRLSLGSFPRPTAVFPSGARPNETAEFKFIGDPAGEFTQAITIPADASGRFALFPSHNGVQPPSPLWIMVSPLISANEVEPNDSAKEASLAPEIPFAMHGIIGAERDVDFIRFKAAKGENFTLQVIARDLRSPLDAVLSVRDSEGKNLANNDDQRGLDSILQWTAPENGEYHAVIRDHLQHGSPDFTYRLEITRRGAAIGGSLPVVERNDSQKGKVISVPRGNRYASVVNFTRENISCDLKFEAESLPAGVSLKAPLIPRSVNAAPVVFEAAADAPLAGTLHRFKVKSAGDAPPLEGWLRDVVHHVEVNNQGAYHSAESDRIAVAVIDEAPFRLELEAPAIPIVKNGTLLLKVRAIRKEGYAEPITLRFLWNPPGIGTPVNLTLPAYQLEFLYEVNAAADATPGEWQVCVVGEAKTPQGPVQISTALVPLRIAEPYLGMNIDMAATEQGKPVTTICKVDYTANFTGTASAELLGLPYGAKSQPVSFPHGQAEVHFPIEIAADAKIGKHTALFCRVTVPENGHTILHQVGQGGTLRIDQPAAAVAEVNAKPAAAPATPSEKPLSRLEQLRHRGGKAP